LLLVVVEAAIFIPRREREEGRLREFAREGETEGVWVNEKKRRGLELALLDAG
jgi:hypothetical protein